MRNRNAYLPFIFAIVLLAGIFIGKKMMETKISENTFFSFSSSKNTNNKISTILDYIDQSYVDKVNINELEDKAITNIIDDLDPHSQYITKEEFDEMNDPLLGSFEGIGVTFRLEKDSITIINPVKGGPSEKVGIMAGDRIVYVDDSLMAGPSIQNREVMRALKGPKGTHVRVKIARRGVPDLLNFEITRDIIPTYSVDASYMIDDKIGFIKLNKFAATTYAEFEQAARKLKKEGMQKLILDLRGNTGGYLHAATEISDEFLEAGKLIVYTEGKSRRPMYIFSTNKGLLKTNDVAVLIDEGSASASEIVAGALQDNDRGVIIGRRSFGKGLVQEQIVLDDSSSIRLTVARYHTPTGRSIQKPYDGDKEKYLYETLDRYITGEVFHQDSIHFADSLKYTTPGGKIVYGGGGIMPDIYVSLAEDTLQYYYNKLVNTGVLFQYAFDYSDANRQELLQYKTVEAFKKEFHFTDAMFNKLVRLGEDKSVKGTAEQKKAVRNKTAILFKAYVARNIFDDEGFYPIYEEIDPVLQRAIEELK